ncbi:hypothetical protein HN014_07230 [Aquimarina sp. TRL1]|uniref:O-antigen ligase family protein n=1 Tax=Aquimarina sp. (strain TRL1) TaxID=2736252 RepID=UPI00158B6D0A|nr:O-antigen ligase family protein [Aquimarina sp. TRL1]QKX04712.1 hypothetical protein HN014_07230 [Aquimarina sp. TRL1]
MNKITDLLKNISKYSFFSSLLVLLSFYPILKEAITSITIITFCVLVMVVYWNNLKNRYSKYGIRPLIINTGFYLVLIFSSVYSDDFFFSLGRLQSSILILIFPIVLIYFFPRIEQKTIKQFSYGFLISNLIILIYITYMLLKGLSIDRFPNLMESSFFNQIQVLWSYPYEFTLSKAHKHLTLFYETHKTYVSLNFLVAIFLIFNLISNHTRKFFVKIFLVFLFFLFSSFIVYSQSISVVFSLMLSLFLLSFFVFKNKKYLLVYVVTFFFFFFFLKKQGFFSSYDNKNTESIFKLIDYVKYGKFSQGTDKRVLIYDCSLKLITSNIIFGYGVGNVQKELNNCYINNNYIVDEFESKGKQINSHNYYLHLMLSGGLLCLVLFVYLLLNNLLIAFKSNNLFFFFFLLSFTICLFTENLLVRILGVLPFTIFNSLFYSINLLWEQKAKD